MPILSRDFQETTETQFCVIQAAALIQADITEQFKGKKRITIHWFTFRVCRPFSDKISLKAYPSPIDFDSLS